MRFELWDVRLLGDRRLLGAIGDVIVARRGKRE